MSEGEAEFLLHCQAYKLEPVSEYRFHPLRKWRFDFFFPADSLAVEIEGGTWSNGRHSRGKGFEEDIRKYNAAAKMGIIVLRFTTAMVKSGEAIDEVRSALLFS
jgi:very-short-patch-repair endonuclease